jgi:hypothetical protein
MLGLYFYSICNSRLLTTALLGVNPCSSCFTAGARVLDDECCYQKLMPASLSAVLHRPRAIIIRILSRRGIFHIIITIVTVVVSCVNVRADLKFQFYPIKIRAVGEGRRMKTCQDMPTMHEKHKQLNEYYRLLLLAHRVVQRAFLSCRMVRPCAAHFIHEQFWHTLARVRFV